MLISARRLLKGEEPEPGIAGEVASRHETTIGQDLRGVFSRLLVTRALNEELRNLPEAVMVAASAAGIYHSGDCVVHVIASITRPDGSIWNDDVPEVKKLGFTDTIAVFRWPGKRTFPATKSLAQLRAAVAELGLVLPDVTYALVIIGDHLRIFFLNAAGDSFSEAAVIPPQSFMLRLDEDHAALAERRVAIVGCGSLGSKIAVILARSGVGRFLLVDDDLFLPDNLVRHDLDWRAVGTHKADSVGRRIEMVNAAAKPVIRRQRLGGQESSGGIESLIESLANCDLIVDATAEPSVFNYLCAAIAVKPKPMVWAEVFGGGFGGLVARHRPSTEPDPASMRRAIEKWCSDQGKPMERPAGRYGGEARAPAIADDADVTVIAGHAARMVIDLLVPRNPSIFPYSAYMVGLKKGWIFDQPFETRPIEMGSPIAAEQKKPLDPEEEQSELNRLAQLFVDYENADSSGPSSDQAP